MNKTHQPNFENIRVPVLERMHTGIEHQLEKLQQKMAEDMGRERYYDILPRNFSILPIEKCAQEDLEKLQELHKQSFDCFWTIEKKKARKSGNMEEFYATYKFYEYMDSCTEVEFDEFMQRAKKYCNTHMTTHKCIRAIMEAPNFIEEVNAERMHPVMIVSDINYHLFSKGYDANAGCVVRTRNKRYPESIICANEHASFITRVLDQLGIKYISLPGERKPSRTSIALEDKSDIYRIYDNLDMFEVIA